MCETNIFDSRTFNNLLFMINVLTCKNIVHYTAVNSVHKSKTFFKLYFVLLCLWPQL